MADITPLCSTGVFIQGRVLGMFVGNSLASDPKKGGEWLQVSLVVLTLISIPVMALWLLTCTWWITLSTSASLVFVPIAPTARSVELRTWLT